jgi:hypothetical protein
MIIKTGEDIPIDAILDEDLEKPRKCPKCGCVVTMVKIGKKIEPSCGCEAENAKKTD